MLPIWIIDLGRSAASTERLQQLLDAAGDKLKPYWHYFHADIDQVSDTASCKAFVDTLVADGRQCYNNFNNAGYRVGNFQIVVLGAADESLTQSLFAPLPGLLRDSLPRIISDHANLGVEITGILFIPGTVNQVDDVQKRLRTAMLLEEVNVLNEQLGSKHYNRVVAYQEVQYKGARFYPSLDTAQHTELLYQILVHLFFVGADSERFFDRIGKGSGIFSLGAASVYYNSEQHKNSELKRLLDKLVAEFKDTGNVDADYADKLVRQLLNDGSLDVDTLSSRLREECGSIDVDLRKMDSEADPHPVWDFFRSRLFHNYYFKFLKFMPARLVRYMQSFSYVLLSRFSAVIRRNRETSSAHFRSLLQSFYKKVFLDAAAKHATIAQVEAVFRAAKDNILKKRTQVELTQLEIVPVPQYLRTDYDKCLADEDANQPAKIMERLKKNLKKEPVVLSLLVRCFLLGILFVFIFVPVLRVLSPAVVNLGGLATIEWLWIPVLFFLPLVIEFFFKLRRHFKRIRRLKYRLLAVTLLSVNRQLSQLLMDELGEVYNALLHECQTQLQRLSQFRDELTVADSSAADMPVPQTTFNQPLLGGSFCGEKLLTDESAAEAEIEVGGSAASSGSVIKLTLSQLLKDDLLALLKSAFRQPEVLEAADLSDERSTADHSALFVEALGRFHAPLLHINTAADISRMIDFLGKNVDLAPLEKMAGVNGMLFSTASNNDPDLRVAFSDYALLTKWQKITPALQSQQVCNCSLQPLPPLSFADQLTLYYAFYRQKNLAYTIAGTPVSISKTDMESLNQQIKEDSL